MRRDRAGRGGAVSGVCGAMRGAGGTKRGTAEVTTKPTKVLRKTKTKNGGRRRETKHRTRAGETLPQAAGRSRW